MAKAPPAQKSADRVLFDAYLSRDADELKRYVSFGGVTRSDLDIQFGPNSIFVLLCMNGRLCTIRYLVDWFKITRLPSDDMLVYACAYNRIETARYLVETFSLTAEYVHQVLDGSVFSQIHNACGSQIHNACGRYLRGLS